MYGVLVFCKFSVFLGVGVVVFLTGTSFFDIFLVSG